MKDVQSHVRGCFKVFFQGLWKPEMWTFKEYFFKELQSQKRGFFYDLFSNTEIVTRKEGDFYEFFKTFLKDIFQEW